MPALEAVWRSHLLHRWWTASYGPSEGFRPPQDDIDDDIDLEFSAECNAFLSLAKDVLPH